MSEILKRKSEELWKAMPEIIDDLIASNIRRPNLCGRGPNEIGLYPEEQELFHSNYDNRAFHAPKWHLYPILEHCIAVNDAIEKILDQYGTIPIIQKHFEQTIDGVAKYDLFRYFGAFGHDLGKWGACYVGKGTNGNTLYNTVLDSDGVERLYPMFLQSGHEWYSGQIIEDKNRLVHKLMRSQETNTRYGLTENQIKYISLVAKFHFELGILREIGKKHEDGFQSWIYSSSFQNAVNQIFEDKEKKSFAPEIILFFIADTQGKIDKTMMDLVMSGLDIDQGFTTEDIERNRAKCEDYLAKQNIDPNFISAIIQYPTNLALFHAVLNWYVELNS